MAVFKSRTVLEIARGLKAFLSLDAGVTRGELPNPERELRRAHDRIERQSLQIERLRRQLSRENRQTTAAQTGLGEGHAEDGGRSIEERFGPAGAERTRDTLRVVHVSASDLVGGAARAAYRLHTGLLRLGHGSSLFVAHRQGDDPAVRLFVPPADPESRARREERAKKIEGDFARYRDSRPTIYRIGDSFNDDRSMYGAEPLEQLPPCDVVNLHMAAGFVDHRYFFEAVPENTPVVWTLHDMNAFTGGCHYDYGCGRYTGSCGACPQLGSADEKDLSREIWHRKHKALSGVESTRLHVVTNSRWLAEEARRSSLLGRFPVTTIPYSLDSQTFAPRDRALARSSLDIPENALVVLFLTDSLVTRRKGFTLLVEALNGLKSVPDLLLLSLGYNNPSLLKNPPIVEEIPHLHFGYLDDDFLLSSIYSAADVFVIPSLQEAFGQTALEAVSCGTPVVGFDVGGIPDIVRPGVTGELAPVGEADALRAEIKGLLQDREKQAELSTNCRRIAVEEYAHDVQAGRYTELYRSLLKSRAQ